MKDINVDWMKDIPPNFLKLKTTQKSLHINPELSDMKEIESAL